MEIVQEIRKSEIPARQSFFAGTYVCNAAFYGMLDFIAENELCINAGFIHLPFLDSQDPDGMDIESMTDAVIIAIETSVNN